MDARLAAAIARLLDQVHVLLIVGVVAMIGWLAWAAATAKPLWHDEIYTVLLARLPSAGEIWAAHRDGVDLQPPLNTFATRVVQNALAPGPMTTRLPALVGFCTMTIVIAAMLRRRAGTTLALAGALIPLQTAAYRYSYEARGYGLMLGLFALALLAWTEAAAGRRRAVWIPVCALALAAGIWAHYYAAFGFAAIAVGEFVRSLRARRVDVSILLSLVAAIVLTLPLADLVRTALEQAPRFWARAGEQDVVSVYRFLLTPLPSLLWGYGIVVAAALAFTAITARTNDPPALRDRAVPIGDGRVPLHELVALLAAGLAPLAMLLAARATSAPFTARYGLIAVVAVAIGLPLIVRWLAPRGSLAEAALVVVLALPLAQAAFDRAGRLRQPADPFADRPLLGDALRRSGPVVASGSLTFLQLWYYAPPLERGRLVYLADPDTALRVTGADTFDRGYLALARWTALPVQSYRAFVERQPEFTVYASGSGWLLTVLEEEGASIEPGAAEAGGRVLRVRRHGR